MTLTFARFRAWRIVRLELLIEIALHLISENEEAEKPLGQQDFLDM